MTKSCSKCGLPKPLAEFSLRVRKDRGCRIFYMSACIPCERARGRKYAQDHKKEAKIRSAVWYKNNPQHKASIKETRAIKERDHAYNAVKRAIKGGKLLKPVLCSWCGNVRKVEAHHWKGYAKKLDVQWLCRGCHIQTHSGSLGAANA